MALAPRGSTQPWLPRQDSLEAEVGSYSSCHCSCPPYSLGHSYSAMGPKRRGTTKQLATGSVGAGTFEVAFSESLGVPQSSSCTLQVLLLGGLREQSACSALPCDTPLLTPKSRLWYQALRGGPAGFGQYGGRGGGPSAVPMFLFPK